MRHNKLKEALTKAMPLLKNYAISLTGDEQKAEKLLQEALTKAIFRAGTYIVGKNINSWLVAAMHNTFTNDTEQKPSSNDKNELLHSEIKHNNNHIDISNITQKLQTLPYEYQQPLLLSVMGYECEEIAEMMGLPIGTINSRIYFAKTFLKSVEERF